LVIPYPTHVRGALYEPEQCPGVDDLAVEFLGIRYAGEFQDNSSVISFPT
jgi:hypothetical protein